MPHFLKLRVESKTKSISVWLIIVHKRIESGCQQWSFLSLLPENKFMLVRFNSRSPKMEKKMQLTVLISSPLLLSKDISDLNYYCLFPT